MIPITIDGPEAQRRAIQELLDPIYASAKPSWWQQLMQWLWDHMRGAINELSNATGGIGWLVVALLLAVVGVVVWLRRTGGLRRSAGGQRQVFADATRSADDHRQSATRALQRGDYETAVAERFRAAVRELEQRGIVDVVPGRTADEVGAEVARLTANPADSRPLQLAALTFDSVVYGKRPATKSDYDQVVLADDAATRLRLRSQSQPAGAAP